MPPFSTPQDAEDAYYDAIDEKNLEAMLDVWEDSEDALCLLPMLSAQRGKAAIHQLWAHFLSAEINLNIAVKHLHWIETGNLAIHLIEEQVKAPEQPAAQAIYATNIYRKGAAGWHLLVHQNSPTPPPPGLHMPDTN